MPWDDYELTPYWDEYVEGKDSWRSGVLSIVRQLEDLGAKRLDRRQVRADREVEKLGITFSLPDSGLDRAWPFDVVPRAIPGDEWDEIDAGLRQRANALNAFVEDVYSDARILSDGVVPEHLVLNSANYRPEARGMHPRFGVWAHIAGLDMVRADEGRWFVLEDNLRVPSGVAYMLENRFVSKRVMGDLFHNSWVRPMDGYIENLSQTLWSLSPREEATVCILTPGVYNAAYHEHAYLAQQLGVHLVEGRDLFVDDDDKVYMKTIGEPTQVDVVYRRVDDEFLDPEVFNPDSMVGTPGLMRAWKSGNVAIVNAPGAGVADDKVLYPFVPDIIRYYSGEEPILANVETYWCGDPAQRREVLANIGDLVTKPAAEGGGHGITIGPRASARQLEVARQKILDDPDGWVAQPVLQLSTVPTLTNEGLAPRHVDLRPFIVSGESTYVTSGGLTRVALEAGSLVVNSSQGGGSKDTWIVDSQHVSGAARRGQS
ncbi:MAG: circularly permuted type 2 ATP-grasp protein [Actinobacteria bacterium]|nr:circularly permuted type 2 ATP-grasp protein [Actinomycetota bacterium]